MDDETDGIVRRDFPRSGDGYDRVAVDAHLEAVAAGLGARPGTAADHELVRAGRVLLAEIAAARGELKRVSDALRDRSATIAGTLEGLLDLDAAAGAPSPVEPQASPTPAAPVDVAGDDAQLRPRTPRVEVAPDGPLPPPPAPPAPAPVAAVPPDPVEAAHDDAPSSPGPVDMDADDAPPPADAASVDAAALADARLVALDMALGGSSREEIAAELTARFELSDPVGLTDEVLAAIG